MWLTFDQAIGCAIFSMLSVCAFMLFVVCNALVWRVRNSAEQRASHEEHASERGGDAFISSHVLERETSYDERIRAMMEELSYEQEDTPSLHPNVVNLKHASIVRGLPDVEESE